MSAEHPPWTWADLLRALGWTVLLVLGFALLLGGAFMLMATIGHVAPAARDHAIRTLHPLAPFRVALVTLLLTSVLYGSVLCGVHRCTIRKYALPWAALFLQPARPGTYARIVALSVPVQIGAGLVGAAQQTLVGHSLRNPQGAMLTTGVPHHWLNYFLLFLAVAVVAPIVEEVAFRGFFYRTLRKNLPPWAAAIISAGAFAVLHGIPLLIPVLFYLGVVFALVVERTRSLYCSMILHATLNTVGLIAILSATPTA